ncbi:putative CdaR family transcriptional regulator [Rhodococcus sp. PML026]|jgi:hypothetical protein|nr:putative CdaR family transcriptional regulator [Rhodococcus sp. PML026]MSX06088.1 hypothetical protein [Actinomycetota bacterium]
MVSTHLMETLVDEMEDRKAELTENISSFISASIHEMNGNADATGLLHTSVKANINAAIDFLADRTEHDNLRAPHAALCHARVLAHTHVPLTALARAYHLGQSRFLEHVLFSLSRATHTLAANQLAHLVSRSAVFIDRVCQDACSEYEAEKSKIREENSSVNTELERAMSPSCTDPLDAYKIDSYYNLTGNHIAIEFWTNDREPFPSKSWHQLVDTVNVRLGTIGRPQVNSKGDARSLVWFPIIHAGRICLESVTDVLQKYGRIRAAIGTVQSGENGFRKTARQAERAARVVSDGKVDISPVVTFEEVAAITLLLEDPESLRDLAEDSLGGLLLDSARNRWLRETLRVYLANNCSVTATAHDMTIHRNTVKYRIRQAAKECGCKLDDASILMNLRIALDAAWWTPSTVLKLPIPLGSVDARLTV